MEALGVQNMGPSDQESKSFDGHSMFEKGLSHSTGTGARFDYIEAHKCFNLAAVLGCQEAKPYREEIAQEMIPGDIASAQKAARQWLDRHVEMMF